MAFFSNNAEDYIRIIKRPDIGIEYLFQEKKKELVKDLSNDSDACYDSDASEHNYVHLEEGCDTISSDSTHDNYVIPNKDIEFQILDIDHYYIEDEDEKRRFNMMLFGKTRDDKSVYVNVEGFCPYFYVEIDERWRMPVINKIISDIQKHVYPKNFKDGLISSKIIKAHKFHGFTNDTEFNFLHMVFTDYDSMKAYARAFEKKHSMLYISRHRRVTFKL